MPPDRYFFGDSGKLLSPEEAELDPDVSKVHEWFAELKDASVEEVPDVSVEEYLKRLGATPRQLQLANCE